AVEPPYQGQPLLAAARVPPRAGTVALEVRRLAISEGRADAGDNAVLDVCVKQAVVRVVGRTQERESGVGAIEVSIDLLPSALRIAGEGIGDLHGPEVLQSLHDTLTKQRQSGAGAELEEETSPTVTS